MRSEGKRTLGPWKRAGDGLGRPSIYGGVTGGTLVCRFAEGQDECLTFVDNHKANAEFIVKACNAHDGMLEALKRILDAHHECLIGDKCNEKDQLCIPCVTRYAIAKAEAKSEPR